MVAALPNTWSEVNNKRITTTKRLFEQRIWGAYTETDDLHNQQHAIVAASPPHTQTHVTHSASHLTSTISRDSKVWRHSITNACQEHYLSHPLHNPIAIFNLHRSSHFTTLITDNNTYSYYDPLNFRPPHTTHSVHNTLRQWYSNLPIALPLLHNPMPTIVIKSTPSSSTC